MTKPDGGLAFPHKAHFLGKLVITTCPQAEGSPFVDGAFTEDKEGRRYKGIAILLCPWRRNMYGESRAQKALVIGWRK